QPGEVVNILLGTAVVATPMANVSGHFGIGIIVPQTLTAGPVTVQAVGQTSGLSATATYIIPAPGLDLSLASVPAGTPVIVTGRNFAAQEYVVLTLGGTSLAIVRADSAGNFVTAVTIPAGQPGGTTE